jgi:predicted Ser/Thr protein kinase
MTHNHSVYGSLPVYKKLSTDSYYVKHPNGSFVFHPKYKPVKLANGTTIELGKHIKVAKPKAKSVQPVKPKSPVKVSPKPKSPTKTLVGFEKTPYFATYIATGVGVNYVLRVYKKTSTGRFYRDAMGGGNLVGISKTEIVKTPSGATMTLEKALKKEPMPVSNAKKAATPSTPGYVLMSYKYKGGPVYWSKTNGSMYTKNASGAMKHLGKNSVETINTKKGAVPIKDLYQKYFKTNTVYGKGTVYYNPYTKAIGYKPTGSKKGSGIIVNKTNTYLQNLLKKFKNPPNYVAPPAPPPPPPFQIVTVTLVPIVKPSNDHVRARASRYTDIVSKIAKRMRKIRDELDVSNTKQIKENFCKAGEMMGFARGSRTNTMSYKVSYLDGLAGGYGWKKHLAKPQFTFKVFSQDTSYTEYGFNKNAKFKYATNVNSYANINPFFYMDRKWFAEQDKYIRALTPRQLFTVYGYTKWGDKWGHLYMSGKFDYGLYMQGIRSCTSVHSQNFYPYFFQARDFYKINTGDVEKDYTETIKRLIDEHKNIADFKIHTGSIVSMWINDLNEIIANAPATTQTFHLLRGQGDDAYKTGAVALAGVTGEVYTSERFCSATVDPNVAQRFTSGGHTLQRITVLKGSKCLLMFGLSYFGDEKEVLLPRGATYQIYKVSKNVQGVYSGSTSVCGSYPSSVKNLVDMAILGTVEPPPPKVTPVPVVVQPTTNTHAMQKYILNSKLKITGLLGKGGYGAVFQGTHTNNGNVAVKFQKVSNNSNVEVKALKKLGGKFAPKFFSNRVFKANNNIKAVIPRGVQTGNNVHVMVSQLIRGQPLAKYYKKNSSGNPVPIPAEIKTKIMNAIKNMHSKGVVHGDLHKDNIIVANNGHVYLIDFGKALVTNKNFKNLGNANNYVKKLTGKTKPSWGGKISYYSNNKRTHFLNGNFLKRLK